MKDFRQVNKVFFLGCGGIGVSAIARMFLLEGKNVYGSDISSSKITDDLEKAGVKIIIGQSINFIPKDSDMIIYSRALETKDHGFLDDVKAKFKNVISYPEALAIISKEKFTIAVCGTHGKTTTTAMIGKILLDNKLDPTVIVGSISADFKSNYVAGRSQYLVVEACEYRRSFLNIHPKIIAITTIDEDHLDYYKDIEDIKKAFKEFLSLLPQDGIIVANFNDANIKEVISGFKQKKIDVSDFINKVPELLVPGVHNRQDAALALAVSSALCVESKLAIESLKTFSGTWRRFEYKGVSKDGIIIYDDYAHHPREISATLSGAREKYPNKNITIVFQPHLYSRTKQHFYDFADILSSADRVILAPIYAAREASDESISSIMLMNEIKKNNQNVFYGENLDDIQKMIKENILNNDVLICMGAGDITKLTGMLI